MDHMTVDDFDAEAAREGGYVREARQPYWVGDGETWTVEDYTTVVYAFRGPRCHGICNPDDGTAIWCAEGWDNPDAAWAALMDRYQPEE